MIAIDRWAKTALGAAIVALAAIAAILAAVVLAAIILPFLLGMVRSAAAAGNDPNAPDQTWQPPVIDSRSYQPALAGQSDDFANPDFGDEDDDTDAEILGVDINADTVFDEDNDSEGELLTIDLL